MRTARLAATVGALALLAGTLTACNADPLSSSDASPSACPSGKASWSGPRLDGKTVLICAGGDDPKFVGELPEPIAAIDAAVPNGCAAIRAQYDKWITIGGGDTPYAAEKLGAYVAYTKRVLAAHGCPVPS